MSCRRALEIDLLAFAVDRTASDWSAFRDHYPRCVDCSEAVARLDSFEAALRGGGNPGPGHLDEEEMLAFVEGHLAAEQMGRAEIHLEHCPICRTEVAVLRAFEPDPSRVAERRAAEPGIEAVSSAEASLLDRLRSRVTEWLAPNPAWAWAAAAAAAILVLWTLSARVGEETPAQVAQREPNAPSSRSTDLPGSLAESGPVQDSGVEERPGDSETRLAESSTGAPPARVGETAPETEADGVEDASAAPAPDAEGSSRLAAAPRPPDPPPTRAPGPSRPPADPSADPATKAGEAEEMLLAALLPADLPRYAVPESLRSGGLEAVRIGGALRNPKAALGGVSVLAPVHVGLTHEASPTLYWVLERSSPFAAEVVLVDPRQIAPVLERRIPPPIRAGLHALDLEAAGVALDPGVDYQWSVSIVPDEESRDLDVVSVARVRFVPPSTGRTSASTPEARAREIHRLADGGSWYDAFDALSRWIRRMPREGRLIAYRRALLSQVDLEGVLPWIEGPAEGEADSSPKGAPGRGS